MRLIIFLYGMSLWLIACQTPPTHLSDAQNHLSERQTQHYKLGVGDQLRVIIFGEDNLSGEFFVDGRGSISLPLVGEVTAKGKTLRQFEQAITKALQNGYLKDPRVNAEVLNYRPYYILGEVENAGEYPYSDDLTVLNAIATAGGFTYRANKRLIVIKRAGVDQEERFPLTPTTPVQPGDTLRIIERLF